MAVTNMASSEFLPESKFGHYPQPLSSTLPSGFSPLGHYSYSPSHGLNVGSVPGYGENRPFGFPDSPRGFSSCMHAGSFSPSMSQTMSPDGYSSPASCTKENEASRDGPTCRRRLDFNHNAFVDVTKGSSAAVATRNERERNRVKLINTTFQTLRQHLPPHKIGSKGKTRKLSKVQTLRSAIDYIRHLQDMIRNKNPSQIRVAAQSGSGGSLVSGSECPSDPHHRGSLISSLVNAKHAITASSRPGDKPLPPPHGGNGSLHYPAGYQSLVSAAYSMKGLVPGSTSSLLREGKVLVPCTSSSHGGSPVSESSSYDCVTTPIDDEFLDFVNWF